MKTALVTGGNGGIGSAICLALKDAGFKVIDASLLRNEELANNPKFEGIVQEIVDVADFASCEALAKKVGNIDVLINNAGITKDSQFKKMSLEQWQDVININLNSVFNVSRQFINGMIDNGWGRIINISSINGQKGQFGQSNYAATKAGVHGFTMSLAQELARNNITVNTISPGYTATPMVMSIREDVLQSIINQVPMKRLAKPEEIAAAVVFLCSDGAEFINGANVPINGAQFTSF